MLKCNNLSKNDLERISYKVANSFVSEEGAFHDLGLPFCHKLFYIIIDTCYQCGHLYMTSEKEEGFCVYWSKKERPGLLSQCKLVLRMIKNLSFKDLLSLLNNIKDWTDIGQRYKKADDYIEVFLLAVSKENQGQGYFRKMLEEVFHKAKERNIICALDTDSELKAAKYQHVGMHVVDSKKQKGGITMYALEK